MGLGIVSRAMRTRVVCPARLRGGRRVDRYDHAVPGSRRVLRLHRVPEYGREFCAEREGAIEWSTEDFEHIARRQLGDEDAAARTASRLLVCDTDALATSIWHERYLGRARSPSNDWPPRGPMRYTSSPPMTFRSSGRTRDGEHLRGWMTQRFRVRLAARSEPWIEVRGGHADRLAAVTEIDALLAAPIGAQ